MVRCLEWFLTLLVLEFWSVSLFLAYYNIFFPRELKEMFDALKQLRTEWKCDKGGE